MAVDRTQERAHREAATTISNARAKRIIGTWTAKPSGKLPLASGTRKETIEIRGDGTFLFCGVELSMNENIPYEEGEIPFKWQGEMEINGDNLIVVGDFVKQITYGEKPWAFKIHAVTETYLVVTYPKSLYDHLYWMGEAKHQKPVWFRRTSNTR